MKNTILSIVIGLSVTLLFTAFVYAQPMQMRRNQHPGGMMFQRQNLMKKLNLTDQQKAKIADLRVDFQKKMIDLKADLQKSRLDLKSLKMKDNLDRSDVTAAVERINKNTDAISLAVANHLMDVYQILTPEQQKIARQDLSFIGQRRHAPMINRMRAFHR